jgi:tripartite-type tricarboxylate transporter receptor subunit TctC
VFASLSTSLKANPGKYSYASAGIGLPAHMAAELFRVSLGLDIVHVPFNGAGPTITSTIAATPIAFSSPASSIAQAKDGKLRALAVATGKRLSALPDVPTMAEAGFPEIEGNFWVGLFVPAGTPADIVTLLHREVGNAAALPDVQQRLDALGFIAVSTSLEEAGAILKRDSAKWTKVIQAAGIKAGASGEAGRAALPRAAFRRRRVPRSTPRCNLPRSTRQKQLLGRLPIRIGRRAILRAFYHWPIRACSAD